MKSVSLEGFVVRGIDLRIVEDGAAIEARLLVDRDADTGAPTKNGPATKIPVPHPSAEVPEDALRQSIAARIGALLRHEVEEWLMIDGERRSPHR